MVAGLLAVRVRQSREPSNLHPVRQIVSLDAAGSNFRLFNVPQMNLFSTDPDERGAASPTAIIQSPTQVAESTHSGVKIFSIK